MLKVTSTIQDATPNTNYYWVIDNGDAMVSIYLINMFMSSRQIFVFVEKNRQNEERRKRSSFYQKKSSGDSLKKKQ